MPGRPFAQVTELLRGSSRVLVVGHVAPDADALGSALALAGGLRQLGVDSAVSFDPSQAPLAENLTWLPGAEGILTPEQAAAWLAGELVVAEDVAGELAEASDVPDGRPTTVVVCDCSAANRMGSLAELLDVADATVAIDHHRTHEEFAQLTLLDVNAPATGVLVAEVLDQLGVALDAPIASALYAAVSSDTGSFRFAGTTAQTHALAGRLLDAGANPAEIGRRLYDERPLAAVRLLGHVLDALEVYPDAANGAGAIVGVVGREQLLESGLGLEQTEPFIDAIRVVREADVALLFKQDAPTEEGDAVWRISARSRGGVDVGEAFLSLGGGGHRFAAGATLEGTLDQALAQVMPALSPLER